MENTYLLKTDVLKMLGLEINKWTELKQKEINTPNEKFIDNVLIVLGWVMKDIEKMA